jgi:hypothetical protein
MCRCMNSLTPCISKHRSAGPLPLGFPPLLACEPRGRPTSRKRAGERGQGRECVPSVSRRAHKEHGCVGGRESPFDHSCLFHTLSVCHFPGVTAFRVQCHLENSQGSSHRVLPLSRFHLVS